MKDKIIEEFLGLVEPLAGRIKGMYLFGSRCREDWRPDSDYDIMVVLEKRDKEVTNGLYDAVMEVLLSTGRLISLKVFTLAEFNRLKALGTPFISNVMKEGVKIGSSS